jgi:hypothetical protein
LFGKDWRLIEEHIGTRNCSQIRSHAQKYFLRFDMPKEENVADPQDSVEMKPRRRSNMFADIEDMPSQ